MARHRQFQNRQHYVDEYDDLEEDCARGDVPESPMGNPMSPSLQAYVYSRDPSRCPQGVAEFTLDTPDGFDIGIRGSYDPESDAIIAQVQSCCPTADIGTIVSVLDDLHWDANASIEELQCQMAGLRQQLSGDTSAVGQATVARADLVQAPSPLGVVVSSNGCDRAALVTSSPSSCRPVLALDADGVVPRSGGSDPVAANCPPFQFTTVSPDDKARSEQRLKLKSRAPDSAVGCSPAFPGPVGSASAAASSGAASPRPPAAVVESDSLSRLAQAKGLKPYSLAQMTNLDAKRSALLSARDGLAKPELNLVAVGHVDAGKSTLMGHLLLLSGSVSQREMHRFKHDSKAAGKASFSFAWVLDSHAEERERGITVDVAVNHFETPNRSVTLYDAPGHRDFIPNMISGAAQADVAILVVDGVTGEFESGFVDSGQTKEHAMLIRSLGISQVIVAVNKLEMVGWSEDRFTEVDTELREFLKQAGFSLSKIRSCPVSGLLGENITQRTSQELGRWYTGPTLVELIDTFRPPARDLDHPTRISVTDVFKTMQTGDTLTGKVESGAVMASDRLLLLPSNIVLQVKHLTALKGNSETVQVKIAGAGTNVSIGFVGVEDANHVTVGQVLCDIREPCPLVTLFEAQIVTFNLAFPLMRGEEVVLHTQSVEEPATVTRLLAVLSNSTGHVKKKNPRQLVRKQAALIRIRLARPLCLEEYSVCKSLGRVTLRHEGETIAMGIVKRIIR